MAEYYGNFWIEEGTKYNGIFTVDQNNNINLKLFGRPKKSTNHDNYDFEQIYGVINYNKLIKNITLENCSYIYEPSSFSQIPVSELFVNTAFIVANSHNELTFSRYHMYINGLSEWVNSEFFRHEADKNCDDKVHICIDIHKPIIFLKNDDVKISIAFDYGIDESNRTTINITQKAFFVFEFNSNKNFDDVYHYLRAVHTFLCLSYNSPLMVDKIYGIHNKRATEIIFHDSKYRPKPKDFHWKNIPFLFESDKTEQVFSKYLDSFDKLNLPIRQYMKFLYSDDIEERFVSITQSLESFHRDLIKKNMDSELKTELKNVLCQYYNRDVIKLTKSGKELTFIERLLHLYNHHQLHCYKFINTDPVYIRDTRNEFTHFNPINKIEGKKIAEGRHMSVLTLRAQCVFLFNLFKLIGYNEVCISGKISKIRESMNGA